MHESYEGADDLQHVSELSAIDFARHQQQAAALHAQQQAAFHQYQAALEARLMLQQHHGHQGGHEHDGEEGEEEEDGRDGRDEDQEEGSLENGEQISASLDDAAPPPDQMNHGRSRTPALMYNGGLYPTAELQHSELGSLGILLQDEMNANALNNQALHEAAGQRTQRERQRVPFHPATGGFRGAGDSVPLVMGSGGDGMGGGPTGPHTSLGYSLSGPPMMPKAMPVENLAGCNCKKSRCLKLYCQCFAALQMCGTTCNCLQCLNLPIHDNIRQDAIRAITDRNPNAFQSKFRPDAGEAVHKIGCKCRKSACLKKYCECFNMGARCTEKCICVGCQNHNGVGRPFGDDRVGPGGPLMSSHPYMRPPSAPPMGMAPSPSHRGGGGKPGAKKRKTENYRPAGYPGQRGSARHEEDDTDMLQAAEDLALLKAGPMGGGGPKHDRNDGSFDGGDDGEFEDGRGDGGSGGGGRSAANSFIRPSILRTKGQKRGYSDNGHGANASDDGSSAVLDSITSSSSGSGHLDEHRV